MNWGVFDYAGHTAPAWTALLISLALALALVGAFGFLLWRRKWLWACFPLPLVMAWGIAWGTFGPRLDHAWLYLQQNAGRTYGTYVGLTFATAFLPPIGGTGAGAFNRLATRDLGFARGRPLKAWEKGGRVWRSYADEDYPDGVTMLEGRTVATGARFRGTRLLTGLVPLFDMPSARTARVVGAESGLYADILAGAGLRLRGADEPDAPADIVLCTPEPDWLVGADTPSAATWRRLAAGLSKGGVAALHLDARLLSRARLKGILADFREVFHHYRFWCTGRHDYVVTSGGAVLADETLELFERPKAFEAFMSAGAASPVNVFACYVGTDFEVEPGLLDLPTFGHLRATWSAPPLAFDRSATNHLARVRALDVVPYGIGFPSWFQRGATEPAVYTAISNALVGVQGARREILLGFDAADAGASTNAIERWSAAAKVNPLDPLLQNLGDALDLEGRRYLRIGNVNGAMRCYENRLLVCPNDVAAVHNFGVCLKKGGHHDIAASVFAKAVTMDPLTDEHRLELVECCAASHKEAMACRQLDVLMKRHPGDPALRLRAARLLAVRGNEARDPARAIALAEEAVRMAGPRDRAYRQALADIYIDCGQPARGVKLKRELKEERLQ